MENSRPLDALNKSRNKRVIVELKNGKTFNGNLTAFDIHINLYLDDATEIENGEVKRKLGTLFLRGDAVILVSPAE
jgi:small nuclear ribonucleoprotein